MSQIAYYHEPTYITAEKNKNEGIIGKRAFEIPTKTGETHHQSETAA